MDLSNINISQPIKPYICEDSYYPVCRRCHNELKHKQTICDECGQVQDWSWLENKV